MRNAIVFKATVGALSEKTVVSKNIGYPFKIRKVAIYFPEGCGMNVEVTPVISGDNSVPVAGKPSGWSFLQSLGQESFVVGDNNVVIMNLDLVRREGNSVAKVYVNNKQANPFDIVVIIEVQAMQREWERGA